MMTPVTVSIVRETRVDDGAGGQTVTPVTVASGLTAQRHFYNAGNEQGHLRQDPPNEIGQASREYRSFYAFRKPFPSVVLDDKIVEVGGQTWRVLLVRVYGWTMQVDVKLIQ